ncbi:MAG: transcriptional regulator TrmB [Candidatus Kerfeldbacteria bacterium]|nr:transcriptional regulator TrmB [Candidatus Kerfeldbacteria bacterium]
MSIEKDLEQFGFDDKKAKVYLAALELGDAKAHDIALKTRLERPTTYEVLNKLVLDGLVSTYEKRGVRHYVAEDPEKIKKQLMSKQRTFDDLLPELRSVYNVLKAKPKIRYYEGVEGIKTVLDDTLNARDKKLRGILSVVDLFKIPGKTFMDDYVARRIEQKVALRVIRSRQKEVPEYWPTSPQALRELRYTPAQMVFSMTTYVYNNKVGLISSLKENFGMIIESEEFHENMGHSFEALWQMAQPDRKT